MEHDSMNRFGDPGTKAHNKSPAMNEMDNKDDLPEYRPRKSPTSFRPSFASFLLGRGLAKNEEKKVGLNASKTQGADRSLSGAFRKTSGTYVAPVIDPWALDSRITQKKKAYQARTSRTTLASAAIESKKERDLKHEIAQPTTDSGIYELQPISRSRKMHGNNIPNDQKESPTVCESAAIVIAEQFVGHLEMVSPSATLRSVHIVDQKAYAATISEILQDYFKRADSFLDCVQPAFLRTVLLSSTQYIGQFIASAPARTAKREKAKRKDDDPTRNARFSHLHRIIGRGGDSCPLPTEWVSNADNATSREPNGRPAFPIEFSRTALATKPEVRTLLLYSTITNLAPDFPLYLLDQGDPTRSLERLLRFEFADLPKLDSFRDLAHECHVLWYHFTSRTAIKRGFTIDPDNTKGVMRKRRPTITIKSDWDPMPILEQLQRLGEVPSIKKVLTITGDSHISYATACENFVAQRWPGIGQLFLHQLDQIVQKAYSQLECKGGKTSDKNVNLSMAQEKRYQSLPHCRIELGAISTSFEFRLQRIDSDSQSVLQILSWISAALRLSQDDECPEIVHVTLTEDFDSSYQILTTCEKMDIDCEQHCWIKMLDRAVIAYGFPIPSRLIGRGLDISLRTACQIIGATKAIECAGGPVIQGLSGLLIPIRFTQNTIQWHLLVRNPSRPWTALLRQLRDYPDRLTTGTADLATMEAIYRFLEDPSANCYIGWHPQAASRAGADSHVIDYRAIRKSGLKASGQGFQIKNLTLGFQQFVTAEIEMGIVPIQSSIFVAQKLNWFDNVISRAENGRVLMYDASTDRGWLLSTAEVLLHLLRRQMMPHTSVRLETRDTAEETLRENGARMIQPGLKIQDIITDKLDVLERLQVELINLDSNRIFSAKLLGFDFLQCADRVSSFVLREAHISGALFQQSWVDLINATETPVLFGNGFGELIGLDEAEQAYTCSMWRKVPCSSYLMTVTAQVLRQIYAEEQAEASSTSTGLTPLKLLWDQGSSMLHEPCDKPSGRCCCQRVQMLRTQGKQFWRQPVKPPELLPETGAVIFGDPGMVKGAPKSITTLAFRKKNISSKEKQSYSAGMLAMTEAEMPLGFSDITQTDERTRQVAT